jgi:cellobiose phosphorylase
LRGNSLTIQPVIPEEWPGFELTYRYRSSVYEIVVNKSASASAITADEDGRILAGATIPLVDDGKTHRLNITLPQVS